MKRITLLIALFATVTNLKAQQTYNIAANGKLSPDASNTKFVSFIFNVDKAFKNKKFDIYLADGTTLQNSNNNILGGSLSKNPDNDNYTVTITDKHKLQGCDNCEIDVSDDFFVKLDGKLLGSFHLQPSYYAGGSNSSGNSAGQKNSSSAYNAGSVINDALIIASKIKASIDKKKVADILKMQYGITTVDQLHQNQFLKLVIEDSILINKNGVQSGINLGSIANSVGGLDVTNIADGFAKFIVKRTKEELSIAFFKKFKEDLNNQDLKTVFPNTYNLLNVIDDQIYNYNNYINNLRDAFRSDIKVLDENLPGIVSNHPDFFKKTKNFELGLALRSGCYISSSLKHDVHPGDILDNYPTDYFDDAPDPDKATLDILKGSIQTLQLFSASLKESDTSKHTYWVNIDKVRQLVNDKTTLEIYIGLLLQVAHNKYANIPYKTGVNFYSTLNTSTNAKNFDNDYTNYKQYITNIGNRVNELNKMIKAYEKPATDSAKVEQYARYFKTSVQLIQSCTQVSTLRFLNKISEIKDLEANSKKYFDIAYQVTDLTTAINGKRYSEAVNHLVDIYNTIYAKPVLTSVDPAKKAVELTDSQKKDLADAVIKQNTVDPNNTIASVISQNAGVSAKVQGDDAVQSTKVVGMMVKYGAFMANMINAKSSDDVEQVIESVALPVGSASIKRLTPFSVSINSYCGLFVGNEVINGLDSNNPFNKLNSAGLTAPIGVSISKGDRALPWPFCFIPWDNKGWSSSMFISLVDLGAIAAYRFEDSSTAQVPSIQLKDIISPGLFWSIGIPKTPISFNFGGQMGPNLRTVTSTTNDYSNKTYVRYSVSICVDIPILNLYTKPKN